MKLAALVLVSLAVSATTARAEPEHYVQPDLVIGFIPGVALEGGHRLFGGPLWLHGEVFAGGVMGDGDEPGPTVQLARAGVEARTCTDGGLFCAMAGIDVGAVRLSQHDSDTTGMAGKTVFGGAAIARLGLDAGGDTMRVRLTVEPLAALGVATKGTYVGPLPVIVLGVARVW